MCPVPTLVAEIVPAASSIACWTGRTWSSIFVWSVTPPVPPENTNQELSHSLKFWNNSNTQVADVKPILEVGPKIQSIVSL